MKQTLEKVVNSVKEVGKNSLKFVKDNARIGILLGSLAFGSVAYGGELDVYNKSNSITYSRVDLKHIEGAIEGFDNDGNDISYIDNPNKLQIYSKNLNCLPFTDKLSTDARGIDSITTFNLELASKGGFGTADNYFRFVMRDNNDFEWKNIFLGGADDSNDLVADIKYVVVNGSIYPNGIPYGDYQLPDVTGNPARVYDKRKIIIRNHADLNRDRKVNFVDWTIFANAYGRTDIEKGSNPDALEDYADIENFYDANGVMVSYGNGTVDMNDMSLFMSEWLWFADDPNTW